MVILLGGCAKDGLWGIVSEGIRVEPRGGWGESTQLSDINPLASGKGKKSPAFLLSPPTDMLQRK